MRALEGDTIVARRLVGLGLAVYGAMSLGMILLLLILVLAPREGDDGLLGLDAQRRQLLGVIDASATAIRDAETAARGVDDTLLSTSSAAASAGTFMSGLARTMSELAASLRISIFGSQPFAIPADEFEQVAAQASQVQGAIRRAYNPCRGVGWAVRCIHGAEWPIAATTGTRTTARHPSASPVSRAASAWTDSTATMP